jgi:hypothetical protein
MRIEDSTRLGGRPAGAWQWLTKAVVMPAPVIAGRLRRQRRSSELAGFRLPGSAGEYEWVRVLRQGDVTGFHRINLPERRIWGPYLGTLRQNFGI